MFLEYLFIFLFAKLCCLHFFKDFHFALHDLEKKKISGHLDVIDYSAIVKKPTFFKF